MTTSNQTANEVFQSLNGYDEIAVAKAFGEDISKMVETPFRFTRALAFIVARREGMKDSDAQKFAMEMEQAVLQEFFADEVEEMDETDPDSEAGKDSSPSE